MEKLDSISLSSIYKRTKSDRDIFQELMPTKVKEVLLVATLYDSYSIVREGQFTDKIFGEYLQLNLYAYPRFTSVNSKDDALKMIKERDFELVIIMVGVDKDDPVKTSEEIRKANGNVPILLLVNNNGDLRYFQETAETYPSIDKVFVWNGNSNVFLAMIKYVEDLKNLEADTKLGSVRVILLVEDSIQYYSRYLPLLYTTVMTQTQNLIEDNTNDELNMILKMRARPKVILVSNYEDAVNIINKYKKYLLAVISDVSFPRNGIIDDSAGVDLLKYVISSMRYPIPVLLQSHNVCNAQKAKGIGAGFINKNSESLSLDIHNFIYKHLGFGNFVFKDLSGTPIMSARTLSEFEEMFRTIPDEALIYHGRRNSFSTWLIARGEITIAEQLKPVRLEDFKNPEELRQFCLNVFEKTRIAKMRGRIINFDANLLSCERLIVRMGKGSLGGKGRGLAFICNFIENIDFKKVIPHLNIRIPATAIIGAMEFDKFLEINELYHDVYSNNSYEHIKNMFLNSNLSDTLQERLRLYIEKVDKPIAVRSSGLFEDSLLQPFSGVYATYLLPNNHPDPEVRYQQLETAVKLVYASVFTEEAIAYFDAVHYKIEEEKMAVVIQEVVGHEYNKKYYPSISGVAQSFNYYPVSYMEPEDGFAVAAIGLGMYVVGGENAFRFCPRYPDINHNTVRDLVSSSQKVFYAIDMERDMVNIENEGEEAAIRKYTLAEAEEDGILQHCASVYHRENDSLVPGINAKGPRVVDFANILKYNSIPLADTIRFLLRLFREAMGSPVEIEYAVDLECDKGGHPTFYLLQIKPLIRNEEELEVDLRNFNEKEVILHAYRGMGNGAISGIRDIVYVKPSAFDKTRTREIAQEIIRINQQMDQAGKEYVLIGPGRWGTRDPLTGVPVLWANISKARIIVEMGLPDFPLESSLGSHFFHNVTSMNVGYFSVPHRSREARLNLNILDELEAKEETTFIRHVELKDELSILMDGRKRQAIIARTNTTDNSI